MKAYCATQSKWLKKGEKLPDPASTAERIAEGKAKAAANRKKDAANKRAAQPKRGNAGAGTKASKRQSQK